MISYVLISSDGQILRSGSRQTKELVIQDVPVKPSEIVIFGQHATPGANQYYLNGQIVDMPLRPSTDHEFDYVRKQWLDPRTAVQKEDQRIDQIRLARAAEYPPIGDQLDVIWKQLANTPKALTIEATKMLASIQMVKEKHPK